MIDEFYFLLDTEQDNNFDFSVYKDYDSEYSDDSEKIYSIHQDHMIWGDDTEEVTEQCMWTPDDASVPVWSINKDTMEKLRFQNPTILSSFVYQEKKLRNPVRL